MAKKKFIYLLDKASGEVMGEWIITNSSKSRIDFVISRGEAPILRICRNLFDNKLALVFADGAKNYLKQKNWKVVIE